jgi:hypothetical protein
MPSPTRCDTPPKCGACLQGRHEVLRSSRNEEVLGAAAWFRLTESEGSSELNNVYSNRQLSIGKCHRLS